MAASRRIVAQFALVSLLSLLVAACGFHLRGSLGSLPTDLQTLGLFNRKLDFEFEQVLRSRLGEAGAQLVESAAVNLTVDSFLLERRPVSLNVRAKAAEYELTGRLTYRLTDAKGKTLLPPQTLNSSRIYTLDEKRVTGKAEEERLLRREIHLDMVNQLVRQLQRVELDRLRDGQISPVTPPDGS